MANQFTGDFDVAAECSMPAANRIVAAMQRIERFPHSMTLHVDDRQPLRPAIGPAIVEIVDAFGDPTVNQRRVASPSGISGAAVTSSAVLSGFDAIVNTHVVGAVDPPVTASNLAGKAQLQVSPPTIEVADPAGTTVRIRLQVMARYFPDAGTAILPEFIRGELQLTTPLSRTISQVGSVVDVDLKTSNVQVSFVPAWSSGALTAENIAGIELLVRNALKTAVLPSNVTLPSNIHQVVFKALGGATPALGMFARFRDGSADPAGAHTVFLSGADDFAVAIGDDYVKSVLQPMADSILAQPVITATLSYSIPFYTFHIPYTFTLKTASFSLEPGTIALTVTGHAHTSTSWMPDFDFTVRCPFSLVPDGATANLVPGQVSLDTSSWVVNLFQSAASSEMTRVRDQALTQSGAADTVRGVLDAQNVLGGVLNALLTPPSGRLPPIVALRPRVSLAYTGIGISAQGVVLHGALGVVPWSPAHVEFEEIPVDGGNRPRPTPAFASGPDYSALKSWIPGGSITSYEWSDGSTNQAGVVDENRFVYLQPPPQAIGGAIEPATLVSAFVPMCLTVRGSRLTSSGPVRAEPVSGGVCGYSGFPIISVTRASDLKSATPMVAVAHAVGGGLEVVGHTLATADGLGRRTPNLVVYRAKGGGFDPVGTIARAIAGAERPDAPSAILVIASPGGLAGRTLPMDAIYSEEDAGWSELFGGDGGQTGEILIVGPDSRVHARLGAELDAPALAKALNKHLVPASAPSMALLSATARLGHAPPNFLFEHAPGKQVTLRKLAGRPTSIVFWRSSAPTSIQAVLEIERESSPNGGLVLAVNDGDSRDVATRAAKQHAFSSTLVVDVDREISSGYGVRIWPTVISVDALGVVSTVRAGRMPTAKGSSATSTEAASGRANR